MYARLWCRDSLRIESGHSRVRAGICDSKLKENINTKIEETKINLPKFSLPSFKGDLDQWLDFKTIFEDTIINNSSLNNIQKFKYQQSSLSGDAASIIKGFL
ncbi:hypothetical protein LAZ67_1001826 [Cordylochernes scorpioides]|uniref:Uncharacterized protein n=1 Tax=Cordylochernes scorpioides TaxID=51811 RepID=A0ABY6JVP8_9ARAC|nr:hypothetical protein LAZ67_1001826 [Cordylochernes scorpioides]